MDFATSKLMVLVYNDQEHVLGIVTKRACIFRDLRSPYTLLLSIQPSQCTYCDFVFSTVSATEEFTVFMVGPIECHFFATESALLTRYVVHAPPSLGNLTRKARTSPGRCQDAPAAGRDKLDAVHPALHRSHSSGPNVFVQHGLGMLRYMTKRLAPVRNLQHHAVTRVPVPGGVAGGRSA